MDDKTKEHALEYGLILGVGALLLAAVFINIHLRIFA
jgi:Flp pilus assembly pilin Flp